MNVATVVRRLENGGFTHAQAAILAEVLHDEVTAQIATKEHVDLVVDRASERLEKMIHVEGKSTIKWVAGMMVVQTAAILTGTVGLVKLFM
jgi:excinuclease UvrABC ATPase subunit